MEQLNRLMGFSRQIQMKIPPCSSVAPLWSYSLLSFHSGIAFLHHREADSPKMCIQSLQFTALVLCQSRCNSALKFALTRRWKEDLVCNPLKLDKLEKICMNLDWSMEWTKLPINHKKSFTRIVVSKFVFSLSASELGVWSDVLPFPPGTVLKIQHSIFVLFFKMLPWGQKTISPSSPESSPCFSWHFSP